MKQLITLLLSGVLFAVICQAETLAIVGDDNAKPKNWLNESGQPQGIMIDLLEEVSGRTGIEFIISLAPRNRSLQLSARGEGAIIGFSKTEERQRFWDYSDPMYFDELVIVVMQDSRFEFTGLDSLAGKRLAIKRGSSYGDDFEEARETGLMTVVETNDRAGQLRMLTLGRVDAILLSPGRLALDAAISENDWLIEHREEFVILNPAYKSDPNYLGVPKSMNRSHLIPVINQALSEIKADGTHGQIVEKNVELFLKTLRNRE